MALTLGLLKNMEKVRNFSSFKRSFAIGKIIYNKQLNDNNPSSSTVAAVNVPGLSIAVLKESNESLSPGIAKNGDYKNPEYFCYDKTSYFEAEIEMLKYRCPQPSIKVPFVEQK